MEQTKSTKMIYSKEMTPLVDGIRTAQPSYQFLAIASLDELLEATARPFPYNLTFEEAVRHPIVVLHSSGSTGMPKPVVMTHGSFATVDNDRNFPTVPGRKNHDLTIWDFQGTIGRIYEPFPPFHLAGFMNKIMVPLYTHTIPVFGPPLMPPSGALVAEIMQQQELRGSILPPAVVEQLLDEPNGLEYFKKLEVLCFAGGPLSQAVGDQISKVTILCQFYGSTEVGQIKQLVPQGEDWSYMEFHPETKLQLEPAEDDAFELVVFADASTEGTAALNHNYPGLKKWRTKDLFRPHPTKKGLWRFHGRRDDIIVLSNGEKFNPVPMELTLQGNSSVAGAVITGQGHFQPALLIEPKPECEDRNSLAEEIWPSVESANLEAPGFGRIVRSMILIAKADKPFARAGKGTVVRKLTEVLYADEIEAVYTRGSETLSTVPMLLKPSAFRPEIVTDFIRSALAQSMPGVELGNEDNFYSFGMDSLKTTEAAKRLKAGLLNQRQASELSWLSANTFYKNPSIEKLSGVVLAFLNDGVIPGEKERVAEMSALLESFTKLLPQAGEPATTGPPRINGVVVALTGSTGSLGNRLLESLLNDQAVSRIYCLDRSATAQQQWTDTNKTQGIENVSYETKVTFLTTDFDRPQLGLGDGKFADLTNDCDLILHTAWKVDFNAPLSSFTENLKTLPPLLAWSASSPRRPRLAFVSSISSVGPWGSTHTDNNSFIPEAPVKNLNAALDLGYGESKLIAERILNIASTQSKIPITILRVGQIGGSTLSTDAPWPTQELVPSLFKTSKALGMIPEDLPPVDWIPVNKLSPIILELAFHDLPDRANSPRYYNLVNPHPVPWTSLLGPMTAHCGPRSKTVPLQDWVRELQTLDASDAAEVEAKPALKILGFFAAMAARGPVARYETEAAERASHSMAGLEAVSECLMRGWLRGI